MRIVVNTRFLLNEYLEGYGNFLYESFRRITEKHPEHDFFFLYDRPDHPAFAFPGNVKEIVTGPAARHPLLWKLWYDLKVPAVLRKYKADIFVSCDGFCSLSTNTPQCLVIHDLAFLHYPSFIRKSHLLYYKRYTPRFLKKARSIATVSEFSRLDIVKQYKTDPGKIDVIPNAAREIFRILGEEEKSTVKIKYTEGKEYFLYVGAIHPRKNLVNLLKAFSVFKKRQQSNYKLVLAGRLAWGNESFVKNLNSYKYRKDVLLTGYLEEKELVQIMGAAYALVYPSYWEGFGLPVLEAMRSGIPVITTLRSAMEEIAKDAALYADPESYTDIAAKMMQLYKDENLRNELISKGRIIEKEYSWEKTASLLWECIKKTAG
jgi:glycosyltransferase involved in cell wall biosynthesis